MELRHLQHFVAVAEDQHFTRAAERLMVSQSGLSASIRALERELRAPLFVRTTRRVTLTEAGRALLAEAERILAQVRAAHEAVAAVQGVVRGTLSVGTEQCIAGVDVAGLLAAFRRRHPDVEIRLRQTGSGALGEEVAAGRLDLAFAYRTQTDTDQLRCAPLATEPMYMLCHPDHRLAGMSAALTPQDVAGEVFVDFHPDWGPRRATDLAFAEAGCGAPSRWRSTTCTAFWTWWTRTSGSPSYRATSGTSGRRSPRCPSRARARPCTRRSRCCRPYGRPARRPGH